MVSLVTLVITEPKWFWTSARCLDESGSVPWILLDIKLVRLEGLFFLCSRFWPSCRRIILAGCTEWSNCHHPSIHRDAQQVTADIPQPPCYRLITTLGRDPRHIAVTEVIPTSSLKPFRYGTVQAGLGSLLRGLDEEGEKPPYASHEKGVPNQFRVYCARVYRICRNARAWWGCHRERERQNLMLTNGQRQQST